MWVLSKSFRFEAAHRLPAHDGKCQRLHGHSWRGTVEVSGDRLRSYGPESGMVIDYGIIAAGVDTLVEQSLDHYYLNETTGLEHPTSEWIALWIYDHLKPVLPGLTAVTIEETCTSRCRYTPEASV